MSGLPPRPNFHPAPPPPIRSRSRSPPYRSAGGYNPSRERDYYSGPRGDRGRGYDDDHGRGGRDYRRRSYSRSLSRSRSRSRGGYRDGGRRDSGPRRSPVRDRYSPFSPVRRSPMDPYEDEERIPPPRTYDHGQYQAQRPQRPAPVNPEVLASGMASDTGPIQPSRYEAREQPKWEKGQDVEMDYGYGHNAHSSSYPVYPPQPVSGPSYAAYTAQAGNGYQDGAYADYEGRDYSGGGGGGAGKVMSEPARDVIFLGLDPNLDEEVMLTYLRSDPLNLPLDSFSILRDRATGQSRMFGFALFASIDAATSFIDQTGPHLQIPPLFPGCQPMNIKLDFSAGSEGRGGGDRAGNDGMRDIGPPGNGNRVLLIRGLDPFTSQEEVRDRLGAEIVRLAGSHNPSHPFNVIDGRGAITRVIIIRHKGSKASCGFAFVELVSADLANALLAHLLSRVAQPVGVVINGRPVACSFANMETFELAVEGGQPLYSTAWLLHGAPEGGIGNAEGWVKYRDDYLGASEIRIIPTATSMAMDPPLLAFITSLTTNSTNGSSQTASRPDTEASAPQPLDRSAGGFKMQPLKLGSGIAKKKDREDVMVALPVAEGRSVKQEMSSSATAANVLGDAEEDEPSALPSKTFPGRSKHVVPPMSSQKKVTANLTKWMNKQGELKADLLESQAQRNTKALPTMSAANATVVQAGSGTVRSTGTAETSAQSAFDYRDLAKMACLLCQRQFKTAEVLRRHCEESDLHKARIRNLADDTICRAGRERKGGDTGDRSPSGTPTPGDIEAQAYRDRAAERRKVFHQPAIPLPEEGRSTQKRKYAEGPVIQPKAPVEPATAPGEDHTNKGNQLLQKMGWKDGAGLGVDESGRKAPVEQLMFAERAGIGASKGKDATKYQGFEGYAQYARDSTYDRYNQSS